MTFNSTEHTVENVSLVRTWLGEGACQALKSVGSLYTHFWASLLHKPQTGFSPEHRTFFFLQLKHACRTLFLDRSPSSGSSPLSLMMSQHERRSQNSAASPSRNIEATKVANDFVVLEIWGLLQRKRWGYDRGGDLPSLAALAQTKYNPHVDSLTLLLTPHSHRWHNYVSW